MPAVTRPPQSGRSLWRFVHDRNPFYLLSAVSMFAGCRAIISAVGVAPGDGRTLIGLVAALQAYEALLIALALFLIRRRGLERDGWILLSIDALFLVDLTLLTGEVFSADFHVGLLVNAACFVLAMVKVGVVVRVLRLRVQAGAMAMIGLQLAAMFGVTGVFKMLARDGVVAPTLLYAGWWAVGAMPALWAIAVRRRQLVEGEDAPPQSPFAPLPYRLYAFLGFVSLVVHLGGLHRVYGVPLHAAYVAPLLLGSAILIGRSASLPGSAVASFQTMLTAAAVFMSLRFPIGMTGHAAGVALTPLRCALAGAAVVAVCALWRHRRLVFASIATACVATAALGGDVREMREHLIAVLHWLGGVARQLMPTTPLEWGVAAVVASFVLLGIGASISLGRPAVVEPRRIGPMQTIDLRKKDG